MILNHNITSDPQAKEVSYENKNHYPMILRPDQRSQNLRKANNYIPQAHVGDAYLARHEEVLNSPLVLYSGIQSTIELSYTFSLML